MQKKTKKRFKQSKLRYQQGGEKEFNPDLVSGVGMLGSSAIDLIDPANEFGARSNVGAAGSGILKGAASGAALGPLGALGGGIIGGVSGLIGNKKAKEEEQETIAQERRIRNKLLDQQSQNVLANYNNKGTGLHSFNKGGKFKQLSPSSVIVDANNPQITDSVDAGFGMVNHNEVIDNKKSRVYSDSILLPTGESIADKAKQLEKQKSNRSKFKDSDNYLQTKLDKLFDYQQSLNNNSHGESFNYGGTALPYPSIDEQEISKNKLFQANTYDRKKRKIEMKLPKYKKGGLSRKEDYGSSKKPYPSVKSSNFAGGHRSYPIPSKADAIDALRLAGLHGRSDVKSKVYAKYPGLKKKKSYQMGGEPEPIKTRTRKYIDNVLSTNPDSPILHDVLNDIPDPLNQDQRISYGDLLKNFQDPEYKRKFENDPRLRSLMEQTGYKSNEDFLKGAFEQSRQRFFNKAASPENRDINIINPNILDKYNQQTSQTAFEKINTPQAFNQQNESLRRRGVEGQLDPIEYQQKYGETHGGTFKPGNFKYGGNPLKYRSGGKVFKYENGGLPIKETTLSKIETADPKLDTRMFNPSKSKMDFSDLADLAATYGSNIANLGIARNLPKVTSPAMERLVNFQTIDSKDQLAEVDKKVRGLSKNIARNTAQSSAANAAKASAVASGISAKNKIIGDTKRTNAQIKNQQQLANSAILGRNTQRTNKYYEDLLRRKQTKQSLDSANLANATEKFLQSKAMKNKKKLDLATLDVLKQQFKDSGVYDRNIKTLLDSYLKK